MTDQGIVSFIKLKLEHSTSPELIAQMLRRAGFSEADITNGFNEVRRLHKHIHQDLVATNDFLPPLSASKSESIHHGDLKSSMTKNMGQTALKSADRRIDYAIHKPENNPNHDSGKIIAPNHVTQQSEKTEESQRADAPAQSRSHAQVHTGSHKKGLFNGRLRRKDFILGFLFFFGVGYLSLAVGAVAISVLSPELWSAIMSSIESDSEGFFVTTIPFILAPITLMMISMFTRRLHNLELPGNLSWLFLVFFLPTSFVVASPLILVLYITMTILFILMITKKGHTGPNEHGDHPESKGSFFRRIFNL